MTWTARDIASVGRSRALHFRDYLRRADQAKGDTKKAQRAKARECRFCFYVARGLATQAFEEYTCQGCSQQKMHPNGAVPKLCDTCADQLGACARCGGTREWEVAS